MARDRTVKRALLGAAAVIVAAVCARASAQDASAACGLSGPVPAACDLFVFDGDSMAAGAGANPGNRLDQQFVRDIDRPARVYNVAVAGRPASDCLALFDRLVAPLYDAGGRSRLILFHAGDNDIRAGRSGADTYRALTAYVARAHAQGWKVAVSTELPRPDFPPAMEAELEAYNALMTRNAAGADAVTDFDTDPHLVAFGFRDDRALFWRDRIHPSDGGYAIMAALMARSVRPLLPP